MNWISAAAYDSVRAVFTRVGNFIPALIAALLILIVGWVLAWVLQKVLVRALQTLRVDDISQTIGISKILNKGEIQFSLSELFGIFLYWLIVLAALLAALNALGLTIAAELLERVLA